MPRRPLEPLLPEAAASDCDELHVRVTLEVARMGEIAPANAPAVDAIVEALRRGMTRASDRAFVERILARTSWAGSVAHEICPVTRAGMASAALKGPIGGPDGAVLAVDLPESGAS